MKIYEIVAEINKPTGTLDEVAMRVGFSRDTLKRKLNQSHYRYDSRKKMYVYAGDEAEKENMDNTVITSRKSKKIIKKSDENNEKDKKYLDEKEITFVKGLYERANKGLTSVELAIEFSQLPVKEKSKKHQMEISEQTLKEFEDFATKLKNKRYSKNDLIEIALVRFMREFN